MRVTHLSLTDFRNYAGAEVPLAAGANLFVGSNGQGKTNLLEAIAYLSTLSSHRVSTDQPMIRQREDAAVIRARLEHDSRQIVLEIQLNRNGLNRAQVNRSGVKPRELARYLPSVMFAPEDLALVRGEPSVRRRFLDELLVQRTPRLSGVLSDYDRVLKQRNSLLKSARASGIKSNNLGTLDIWDERLVALGSEIIDERRALVDLLARPLREAYLAVAREDHSPRLVPQISIEGPLPSASADSGGVTRLGTGGTAETFRAALTAVRTQELDRGVTLTGPHRDDLLLELNGMPAKGYASHGESWSYSLALRLASAQLLRQDSSAGDPVLMLDDVFAELDTSRRRRLAAAVQDFEQILITAAVLDDVPHELAACTTRIEAGSIVDG